MSSAPPPRHRGMRTARQPARTSVTRYSIIYIIIIIIIMIMIIIIIIIIIITKITARQLKMNTVLVVPKNQKKYFRLSRTRAGTKELAPRRNFEIMVSNPRHK